MHWPMTHHNHSRNWHRALSEGRWLSFSFPIHVVGNGDVGGCVLLEFTTHWCDSRDSGKSFTHPQILLLVVNKVLPLHIHSRLSQGAHAATLGQQQLSCWVLSHLSVNLPTPLGRAPRLWRQSSGAPQLSRSGWTWRGCPSSGHGLITQRP